MQRVHRLRGSRDFRRVTRRGRSVACPSVVLYHFARDVQGPPRVGFAVPRRIGKAVVRNRVKRRLREALRPLLPRLEAGVDIVIVARGPIVELGSCDLREMVAEIAARAGLIRTHQQEEGTST